MSPAQVAEIMGSIKLDLVRYETQIVEAIVDVLDRNGVRYQQEVRLGKGCRVDLLLEGGIVIEAKKGKPNSRTVSNQVKRYAGFEEVNAVILVSERGLASHINEACGKKIHYVALSKNWGIGL